MMVYAVKTPPGRTGAIGAANFKEGPAQCRITMEIEPITALEEYGAILRSDEKAAIGYRFNLSPNTGIVTLGNTNIKGVTGLNKIIKVDIILKDDIMDVSIDGRRCIVNRTPEWKGTSLWLYGKHGTVKFKSIKIYPLT